MGTLVEMTGAEDVAAITPKMLQGVSAAEENKEQVAGLLLEAAQARYGLADNKKTFRSVAARGTTEGPYTVYVLVNSEVHRDARVEIEKAWAKDAS
jgi:glutamate-1-semialdehyde aminotransferase